MKNINLINALKILKNGGTVVYPTDTAYGLAVDATNEKAVRKLYKLKGRNFKNPVHVIPPSRAGLNKLVKLTPAAEVLIDSLMPGAVTLVLPLKARGKSWQLLSAKTGTLGIRRPKNKIALDLAWGLGRPITTTSANVSDKPNCFSISEVKKQFLRSSLQPDFYLDGGKLKKTKLSTVVLLVDPTPTPSPKKERGVLIGRKPLGYAKILREGPVTEKQIYNILNKLDKK